MKRGILYAVAALVVFVACADEPGITDNAEYVTEGYDAVFGPDGRICYVERGVMWLRGMDGDNRKRLSPVGHNCFDPDWSPDGKTIVYYATVDGESNDGVYEVPSEGGKAKLIVRSPYFMPAWSITGDLLALTHPDLGLCIIDRENAERPQGIKSTEAWYVSNPDGGLNAECFIFASDAGGVLSGKYSGIWEVNGRNGELKKILDVPGVDDPVWSPDGNSIAYVGGNREIYTYDLTERVIRQVTYGGGWAPAWSPDGRAIIFTSNRDGFRAIYNLNLGSENTLRNS